MREKVLRISPAEKDAILEKLAGAIAGQEEILFAYVFGSFSEDAPFHDIDVGIYLSGTDPAAALRSGAETALRLEQALRYPVDVSVLNSAPLPFLFHVIRGLPIFARDEDLRAEIVEQTVRRYLDIKPLLLRGTREAFAA